MRTVVFAGSQYHDNLNAVTKEQTTMNEKYSMVRVVWADAHTSESGWLNMDEQDDDGEMLVHTVGYLIPTGDAGSKDKHIAVWQTLCDGEGIHGFYIPVAMVREMVVLGVDTLRRTVEE